MKNDNTNLIQEFFNLYNEIIADKHKNEVEK